MARRAGTLALCPSVEGKAWPVREATIIQDTFNQERNIRTMELSIREQRPGSARAEFVISIQVVTKKLLFREVRQCANPSLFSEALPFLGSIQKETDGLSEFLRTPRTYQQS